MGDKALVTVGTDGLSDWVQLSDGVKQMLGHVSVLKFVTELAQGGHAARETLDRFLKEGEALLTVDVGRMWELLKPRRARWASPHSPLIPPPDRTPFARQAMADTDQFIKDAISNQVGRIEQQLSLLSMKAKEAGAGSISANMMKVEMEQLRDMIAWLRRPSAYGNQSQNSTYYGLSGGTPGGVKQASDVLPAASPANFDSFKENTALAEQSVAMVAQTEEKIDQLVLAGKKFDVARAKADLHKVASRVNEITKTVNLAQPWVRNDLVAAHRQATALHGLFATAKV